MYDPYNYGGIIPFFCSHIPEEIQYIIDDNLTEDNKKKVTWFINNIIEIDRRCKLIIEIYKNKKLIFRKYFQLFANAPCMKRGAQRNDYIHNVIEL